MEGYRHQRRCWGAQLYFLQPHGWGSNVALLSRLHVTSAIVRWDNTSFSRRHRARTFCLRHMILGTDAMNNN
jgi:hypothetical protein